MVHTDHSDPIMALMRTTVEQIQRLEIGASNESIARCMVLAGLELWGEAIGTERLAIQLATMVKGVEQEALVEAATPPPPPLAH